MGFKILTGETLLALSIKPIKALPGKYWALIEVDLPGRDSVIKHAVAGYHPGDLLTQLDEWLKAERIAKGAAE